MSNILLISLILTAIFACLAVTANQIIHGALALAAASVMVALVLYQWNMPLAAVFELSVCAGLITVLFLSTISLVRKVSPAVEQERARGRVRRFYPLPVLAIVIAVLIYVYGLPVGEFSLPQALPSTVQTILWNERRLDIIGQILVILAGAFGVVVLFKHWEQQ